MPTRALAVLASRAHCPGPLSKTVCATLDLGRAWCAALWTTRRTELAMEGAWGTGCPATESVCSTLTCGVAARGAGAAAARFRPRLAACPLRPLARRLNVEFQRFLMALSVLRAGSPRSARLVCGRTKRGSQGGLEYQPHPANSPKSATLWARTPQKYDTSTNGKSAQLI